MVECSELPDGVAQQRYERLELYGALRRLGGLPIEGAGREARLRIDELGDAAVDRLRSDDAPRRHGQLLTDAVHTVDRLRLLGVGPAELREHDVRRGLQVHADARRGQRA